MLALIAAAVLSGAAAPAGFTLEPSSKPGTFALAFLENPAARVTLTVTPWPPPPSLVRAEVRLVCESELVPRVLAVLEKHSERPRAAVPKVTLDGPAAIGARVVAGPKGGATVRLDGAAELVLDVPNATGTISGLDAQQLRLIEAVLVGVPRRPTPIARLEEPLRIVGPGAEPLWSGRRGVLFLDGRALKLWEAENGLIRVLGSRASAPLASRCGPTPSSPCVLAETPTRLSVAGAETLDLPKGFTLPVIPKLWVSTDGRWVGAELVAQTDDEQQHLWFYERKRKRTVRWEGPADFGRVLDFTAWGSKGVLFRRSAPCLDTDEAVVNDAACLLDLETGKLSPVGNARMAPRDVTSPDRAYRLSYASMLPVMEQTDGGGAVRVSAMGGVVPIEPVWISNRVLLVNASPLQTVDLAGVTRLVIEERLQLAGGQLDGARVWYQTSDGLFVARVVPNGD